MAPGSYPDASGGSFYRSFRKPILERVQGEERLRFQYYQQLYFNNRMAKRCVVVCIEPHLQAKLPQVSYEIECFFLRVPVDCIKFVRENITGNSP